MQPPEGFPELQTTPFFVLFCSTDEDKAYLVAILEETNSILHRVAKKYCGQA